MLLPVVQRELLVSSRQRLTYYTRALSAGILLPIFAMLHRLQQEHPGFGGSQMLFVMSVFVFIEAMLAGVFYTSDCLSEEKREGTLGLLFLTDLGRLDIVLGKIVARGLRAFFNLLATFPMLALCLFIGGVTGSQVVAMCLTLVVTALFSLAAGAFISSRGLQERNVLLGTFLFLLLITFAPLALNAAALRVFNYFGLMETVYLSPYFAFSEAQRGFTPRLAPSLWALTALSAGFLGYAAWRIRHRFGEPELKPAVADAVDEDRPVRLRGFVGTALDWMARRGRIRTSRVAFLCVLILLFGLFCLLAIEEKWNWAVPIVFLGSYGVHLAYKFFLAAETCRQLNEDRRSGALELLLVTPANVAHIIRAQLVATWRAWAPVGVCVALMNYFWLSHREFDREPFFESLLPISILLLVVDSIVLPWRAVLGALGGERYPITVFKVFTRTMGPPIAVFAFGVAVAIGISDDQKIAHLVQAWACITIAFNIMLIADARAQLKKFRALASGEKLERPWAVRRPDLRPRRMPLAIPVNRT